MSSLGVIFKVTTFGESHSHSVGVIVDGCPPRMRLSEEDIQPSINRRRPGQSHLTTARNELDLVKICSGVENGFTLGTPIMLQVMNKEFRPNDYSSFGDIPRPSHADYSYIQKYGINASSGGGRASARETIGRVAAGAIAEKWLNEFYGTEIVGWVSSVKEIEVDFPSEKIDRSRIDLTPVRCPDQQKSIEMISAIEKAKEENDSIGGTVSCICYNVPTGLGEPVFNKLKATLAQGMMSIPAAFGFEIGSGFNGTKMKGSEHNDLFVKRHENGKLDTKTNNSGGIQGGITNGQNVVFKVAFKPVSTIGISQKTLDYNGDVRNLEGRGRHDPCVLPRAVPIVESMAAIILMDAALQQIAREESSKNYPFIGRANNKPRN